jgi:hypothetical protein
MVNINWHIKIGSYKLMLLDSVEIHESVDLLADTATIVLPGAAINETLKIESKIKRGDTVLIQLGYDDELVTEFEGYLEAIATDDGSIKLTCEDGIFQTRVPVKDVEMKNCTSKDVAAYLISEINQTAKNKLSLQCDYEMKYDKFVISKAMGYDVFKKLQEESKGNIYAKGTVIHFHPAYLEKFGDASYDFAVNIEKSDLVYKKEEDRRVQVEVEGFGKDGQRVVETVGTTGGEKRCIKINGVTDEATLRKRGEEELKYLVFTGFEGSITAWHIPVVHPGYSAKIKDADYTDKTGTYYVTAVTTSAGESGIVRKVQLGRKLA